MDRHRDAAQHERLAVRLRVTVHEIEDEALDVETDLVHPVDALDPFAHLVEVHARKAAARHLGHGRLDLSCQQLADATLAVIGEVADRHVSQGEAISPPSEPELLAAWPMLCTQIALSQLPAPGRILLERYRSREGLHLFLYPFAGRLVHTGLAQLFAWRLAARQPAGASFSLSVNDLGLEIVMPAELALPHDEKALRDWLLPNMSPQAMTQEILDSLKAGHLPQRRFREIARVSGLVSGGLPGARKSTRQIQASSSLFYEVFRRYDEGNRLLHQAEF